MEKKLWYLKQIDLFQGIPDREIMAVAHNIVEKTCQKKEVLYTPFEISDSIYVIKKGEVTLYHLHKGKKLIIDVLKAGSVFGNTSFQLKTQSSHFAEVSEPAHICIFQIHDFLKIVQSMPQIMLRLLQMCSERLAEYEKNLKVNLFDAKEKIFHTLQTMERKRKSSFFQLIGGGKITHEKLSHHTGLSRETVSRAIGELRKEGKIIVGDDGSPAVL